MDFNKLNASPTERVASRIESDVERVKTMTKVVEGTVARIIGHARMLGYYEPTPTPATSAPTSVVTTLADALNELSRAIDNCSGSLNVFD